MAAAMGMDTGVVVVGGGPPVVKAASDKRLYEVLKLPNGLAALLIHDPAMSGLQPEEDGSGGACGHGACGHDHHDDDEEDDEDYEEGEEDEEDDEDDEDEDDDGMEVDGARGTKRGHGHVHKACCSNGKSNNSRTSLNFFSEFDFLYF